MLDSIFFRGTMNPKNLSPIAKSVEGIALSIIPINMWVAQVDGGNHDPQTFNERVQSIDFNEQSHKLEDESKI